MEYLITEYSDPNDKSPKVIVVNERELWGYIQNHQDGYFTVHKIGELILDHS